ncbi:MAG: hypothetical protein IJT75_02385 [Bacteroidaceae bacterium]|nr:hypothetical protein [Bacteroidaceae bacterium]
MEYAQRNKYQQPAIGIYQADETDAILASSLNSMDGDAGYGGGTTGDPRVKEDLSESIWDVSWED